jgi:hypothetical protein
MLLFAFTAAAISDGLGDGDAFGEGDGTGEG